jgi:protein-S-isoprenylcysteine O-methyltransferase Ste14
MKIKGLGQLRKHHPDLNSFFGIVRSFLPSAVLISVVSYLLNSNQILWPAWTFDGVLFLTPLAFMLFSAFFLVRKKFQKRFGRLAYSKAFSWLGFPAVSTNFVIVAHFALITGPEIAQIVIIPILGWYLVIVGGLLFIRSLEAFGVDYLTAVYTYFPSESRMADQKIYDILRHPVYGAGLRIASGLALINANWYSLASALVFGICVWTFVTLVEERELIERFGKPYKDYRRKTPAFWPRPRNLILFYRYLIGLH